MYALYYFTYSSSLYPFCSKRETLHEILSIIKETINLYSLYKPIFLNDSEINEMTIKLGYVYFQLTKDNKIIKINKDNISHNQIFIENE